jgi:hypothetical protein
MLRPVSSPDDTVGLVHAMIVCSSQTIGSSGGCIVPCQVLLYLNWLRFIVECVMPGRLYVFINLDETSISSVTTSGRGLVAVPKIKRDCGWTKPLDRTDRTNVKTSLMAAVCECPKLQPFLPQVILPKYTKRITPPPRILNAYANTGGPFEYWHRSTGWPDCQSMIRWATRLRSVVSSFNSDAWIILMMDCSYCHLNIKTIRHLRRLGILVVIIPAKLTWLVQLLDVYVFFLNSRVAFAPSTLCIA